jgi:hypothetical protein
MKQFKDNSIIEDRTITLHVIPRLWWTDRENTRAFAGVAYLNV